MPGAIEVLVVSGFFRLDGPELSWDVPMSDTVNTAVDADGLAAQVMAVIARTQRIPADSLSLDKTFEELKIDSLDGINIIFAIENEFGINIPDEGVQNLQSVRQVVDGVRVLVDEKKRNNPPDAV